MRSDKLLKATWKYFPKGNEPKEITRSPFPNSNTLAKSVEIITWETFAQPVPDVE